MCHKGLCHRKRKVVKEFPCDVGWICLFKGRLHRGGHPDIQVANDDSEKGNHGNTGLGVHYTFIYVLDPLYC